MAKRDYFLLVDTETTICDHVADFGAVVVNRKGEILKQCGVLVTEFFGKEALFYIADEKPSALWSKQGKDRRFTHYESMIENGSRMLGSVKAINGWLQKVLEEYDPIVTAYNLPFDLDKCNNSGINLDIFAHSFCLWKAAFWKWGTTKQYLQFVLDVHAFNPPTPLGNMSYKTSAEPMARFVLGDGNYPDEPHTALEDVIDYELPILRKLVKDTSKKKLLTFPNNYSWQGVQVRDFFQPKA